MNYGFVHDDVNYKQSIDATKNQINSIRELNRNLIEQIFLSEQEVALAEKNERRSDQLYKNNAESTIDYEKARAAAFQSMHALKNKKSAQLENKIQNDEYRYRLSKLLLEKEELKNRLSSALNKSIQDLSSVRLRN